MSKSKKESFFWTSYSDLMTSLFFVMLVLFVLVVVLLHNKIKVTEAQLRKIKEIEASINKIDTTYFEYDELHKKHILKIDISFQSYSFDIKDVSIRDQEKLIKAGKVIYEFIKNSDKEAKYLLIIEGQSSKDGYYKDEDKNNYVLSYQRALKLYGFWKSKGVILNDEKCEVIISGSGEHGSLRKEPDDKYNKANQRFLIHIIPKPGILSKTKERTY